MNNLWSVQQAVFTALNVSPWTGKVFDAVPQGATHPYIVIGEFTAEQDEDLAVETTDASITFHTWSKQHEKGETHAMLQFLRTRLHRQSIAGTWSFAEDFLEIMEDVNSTAASRLYHGIARYRVRVG